MQRFIIFKTIKNLQIENILILISILFSTSQSISASKEKTTSSSGSNSSPSQSIFRMEGAYSLFSGESGTSFSGATGYSAILGFEKDQSTFRLFGNLQLDYLPSTSLEMAGNSTSINYTGFKLGLGAAIFPLTGSGMQPFVSAAGTYARGGVNVSPETPELSNFFRTNLYGYEISVGVDFKVKRSSKARFRIRATYSSEQGAFASITTFATNALKISAGFGF